MTVNRVILAWRSWKFRRSFAALANAHQAEREAKSRGNTQAIHRARMAKRECVHSALRGGIHA